MKKKALITGITGQDGSYLAEFLFHKGYKVFGLVRPSTTTRWFDSPNLHDFQSAITPVFGDLTDFASLVSAINTSQPDEIYNLAAQSHVHESFGHPMLTHDVNGRGVLNLLTAMRVTGSAARLYQASTSEMFGDVRESPQTEKTPLNPVSPYAVSKVYAHWMVTTYRRAYGMFACNGILFNHESPRRGFEFVTRKITLAVARIMQGKQNVLSLGNLDAERDWGHAKDYVRAMWLMLQHDKPDDYVVATGKKHTVRQFVEAAFGILGKKVEWVKPLLPDEMEKGIVDGHQRVRVDSTFIRPSEVHTLCGSPKKAEKVLGWKPEIEFPDLVRDMMYADMARAGRE